MKDIFVPEGRKSANGEGKRYSDMTCTFQNGKVVSDQQVYDYVKKHTHWWDRLDPHKMSDAALLAFDILSGDVKVMNEDKFMF